MTERDGRITLALGVPVEEYPACGPLRLTTDVAKQLDAFFNQLPSSGAELAQPHRGAPRSDQSKS